MLRAAPFNISARLLCASLPFISLYFGTPPPPTVTARKQLLAALRSLGFLTRPLYLTPPLLTRLTTVNYPSRSPSSSRCLYQRLFCFSYLPALISLPSSLSLIDKHTHRERQTQLSPPTHTHTHTHPRSPTHTTHTTRKPTHLQPSTRTSSAPSSVKFPTTTAICRPHPAEHATALYSGFIPVCASPLPCVAV